MDTQSKYNEAFAKIADWVCKNIPKNMDKTIEINFPHDVYVHRAMRIYPEGETTLLKGSWGWDFDYEFGLNTIWDLHNGKRLKQITDSSIIMEHKEKTIRIFVDSWKSYMRPMVEEEFKKYEDLDNFEA